jgi:hypothetical protein
MGQMCRTFDSVRRDLHPPGIKCSIFAALVINAIDGQIDHHIRGNNIYGIYSGFAHLIPHATVEPYVLWRVPPGNVPLPETAGHRHLDEVTGGARIAGTSNDAWAGHWNAGYTFKNARTQPRPTHRGTRNPNGKTWGTHDRIYASAHDKMDFADQFGWKKGAISNHLGTEFDLISQYQQNRRTYLQSSSECLRNLCFLTD